MSTVTAVRDKPLIELTIDADSLETKNRPCTPGMTWSPRGILRAPSTRVVHGRLVPDTRTQA
jgi:hypothetical protein